MTKPLLAACLALATLTACTGDPLSRTGESVDATTLTAVWGQGPTAVGGDVLGQLIKVTDHAAVRVAISDPPRVGDIREERHAVEALQSGASDITVVRAGLLQLLGADSLAPLGAPFVVTSAEQAEAIAADSELTAAAFSDLDDLGLVGLGLVSGGLRHPFGYGTAPLLGASDYRQQVINVREDAGVRTILDELGATADNSVDSARSRAAGKTLRGIELSLQQSDAVTLPAVETANVTLYVKFDVAVIRRDAWDALDAGQRQELHDSFLQAAAAAIGSRPSEQEAQAAWCGTPGASSVLATPDDLASLHAVLDPITARLAQDPDAERALNRMRELGAGTSVPSASVCTSEPEASSPPFLVTPKGDQSVLDGLWRLEVDEQALLDAGVSPDAAYSNAGVWEFRITAGYADGVQPDGRPCNGQLAFDGSQVSLDLGVRGNEECDGRMRGTYRLDGSRVFFDWHEELEYDVLLDQVTFAQGMVRIQ